MTYMSLETEIDALLVSGRVFQLATEYPGLPQRRTIYVSHAVNNLLLGPWTNTDEEYRIGQLRYWLDRFISGGRVYVREQPRAKKSTADMAQLEPWIDEIWEIRSIDPKPSLRVFGSFAQRDVFLALTWAARKSLDYFGGPKWQAAIAHYKAEWQSHFNSQPLTGVLYPSAYLSNAVTLD